VRRNEPSPGWCGDAAHGYGIGMPLLEVVIVLIIVGVALWLINTYIPMAGSIKSILNLVVVVAVIVWLLKVFGLWGSVANFRVGH
jgi:Flp pilus assembly protein TadB